MGYRSISVEKIDNGFIRTETEHSQNGECKTRRMFHGSDPGIQDTPKPVKTKSESFRKATKFLRDS